MAQALLRAGLPDKIAIHLVPVLVSDGRPLFSVLGPEHIELEPLRVPDAPCMTRLRYRAQNGLVPEP